MRRIFGGALALLLAFPCRSVAQEPARPSVQAMHAIALDDAVGDVSPIHTTDKDYPGLDVVKLAIRSDGTRITIAATLHERPGDFASDVVRLYFDTDANPTTGAQFTFPKIGGFEYEAELGACVSYADRSEACAGGTAAKAVAHWGAIELNRYKGKAQFDVDPVVSAMGFFGRKASARTKVEGTVVESTIEYSDLHVKAGQTIRVVCREAHGMSAGDGGFFPDVLLTLK